MLVKNVELEAVTAKLTQYPEDNIPEIAFAGRSNVGKSSLINLLINRKNFARTSSSPGKTRTINFYNINQTFRIVDLPGYGYAKVSKQTSENWGDMIEEYLKNRQGLRQVFQLVDLRHAPTDQDKAMYAWLKHYGLSGTIIGTKADKISRNEQAKNINLIRKELLADSEDRFIPISALKKTGVDEVIKQLESLLTDIQ